MNITILYSLPTKRFKNSAFAVTDEDTEISARIIEQVCRGLGMQTTLFPLSAEYPQRILDIKADCVVNLIEWTGSDMPAAKKAYELLDSLTIPYTGADWKGYLTTSEKIFMKKRFEEDRIPTPHYVIVSRMRLFDVSQVQHLAFPVIVKLASDHCSIGITRDSIVHTKEDLQRKVAFLIETFGQDVIIEEFIAGREFQVTALEIDGNITILPLVEICFEHPDQVNFLTFGSRWDENNPDFHLSTMSSAKHVPDAVEKSITEYGKKAFRCLGMRDYGRFDIRMRKEEVYFLEGNANPGLDDSLECGVTLAAHMAGISFSQLIQQIIHSALQRKNNAHL
jgi:D-alanine-D-alanine ligase